MEESQKKILYVKACIVHSDLKYYHKRLIKGESIGYQFIRFLLVPLQNFKDVFTQAGTYNRMDSLKLIMSKNDNGIEFYNHLRNKIGGHLDDDVIHRLIQWEPYILHDEPNKNNKEEKFDIEVIMNLRLLEVGINTYCNNDQVHKIFENDTIDLLINAHKFTDHLFNHTTMCLEYLTELKSVLEKEIIFYTKENLMEKYVEAGKTNFRLNKKDKQ